jgi:hypothetical protein
MSKTTFGPGVVVTSKFLNGAQQIYFDGADLDWHYPPISLYDIQRGGENGLDNIYVTLKTDQTYGGTPIIAHKSFMSLVEFGDTAQADPNAAPKSWSTVAKFNLGGSSTTWQNRFDNLANEDLLTKSVLSDLIGGGGSNFPIIDEGFFGVDA